MPSSNIGRILGIATLVCCFAVGHSQPQAANHWGYLPKPIIPADNPLTPEKITLGQRLFNEPKLSHTGRYSCASCHQPDNHFTDGRKLAIGATGEIHGRHTPTLYYSGFNASLGWQDDGIDQLERQHLVPLTNTDPIEIGYHPNKLAKLVEDPVYREMFFAAFHLENTQSITTDHLVKALASYVRTLTPPDSAFDHYLFEDQQDALSADAKQGLVLFFSSRLGCANCHASFSFSGPIRHAVEQAEPVFHVTGVSSSPTAFRAPTLRQIAHTAPYMHDGSLATLEEVIHHYQQADQARLETFTLSNVETKQLIAFLRSL